MITQEQISKLYGEVASRTTTASVPTLTAEGFKTPEATGKREPVQVTIYSDVLEALLGLSFFAHEFQKVYLAILQTEDADQKQEQFKRLGSTFQSITSLMGVNLTDLLQPKEQTAPNRKVRRKTAAKKATPKATKKPR